MVKSGSPLLCYRLLVFIGIIIGCYDVNAMPCTFMTSNDGDHADCSRHRMTHFPTHWSDDVLWLDISFNFLTSLSGLADPKLAKLHYLDVSRNLLTSLSADAFRYVPLLEVLDLGHNALVTLPDDVFRGLHNLTRLVLRNTRLSVLPGTVLSHLTRLTSLDLSYNVLSSVPAAALQRSSRLRSLDLGRNALQTVHNHSLHNLHNSQHLNLRQNSLSRLEPAAFSGLEKLETLDLSLNQWKLDNVSYPPGVFGPLAALDGLYLNDNDESSEGEYPLNVFDPLRSLKSLSVDTFSDPHFGAAFASLTGLRSLILEFLNSNGCGMKRITNSTFTAFHHSDLQALTIRFRPLLYVDTCAFCHLPHLNNLTISGSKYLRLSYLL